MKIYIRLWPILLDWLLLIESDDIKLKFSLKSICNLHYLYQNIGSTLIEVQSKLKFLLYEYIKIEANFGLFLVHVSVRAIFHTVIKKFLLDIIKGKLLIIWDDANRLFEYKLDKFEREYKRSAGFLYVDLYCNYRRIHL